MEGDKTVVVVMEWSKELWDIEQSSFPTWFSHDIFDRKVEWKMEPTGGTILIRGEEVPMVIVTGTILAS